MKLIFPTFVAAVFILTVSYINTAAQSDPYPGAVDAKVISLPKPHLPKEAKETGLGGRVSVLVEIDAKGNILSASDVTGPDSTCPAVIRPDVLALREAAKAAALKAKLSPATRDGVPQASTLRLDFEFEAPERKQKDAGITAAQVVTGRAADQDTGSVAPASVGSVVVPKDPPQITTMTLKPGATGSSTPVDTVTYTGPPSASHPNYSGKTISGGVLNGRAMRLPKPRYPPAARAVRATGAVSVQVLIDTDGTMFSAQAISGHPLLRRSSEVAACDSRFAPTLLGGQPVKVSGIIVYNYVP